MRSTSWPLAQRVAFTAIALGTLLAGCGGSTHRAPENTMSRVGSNGLVRAEAPGSVSAEAGSAVPLGITHAQLVRRLGEPLGRLHRKDAHYRCMLYAIVGQPPRVQLQYCFAGGKLRVVASYIRGE